MLAVRNDVRDAVRSIARAPGFALICVVTLGLGIGATATMFGVIDRLVLRAPDDIVNPAQLRRVYATLKHHPSGVETGSITGYAMYTALRDGTHGLSGVAAYQASTWVVGEGVNARRLPGVAASADFFPLVGARPYLGRFFSKREDEPNASVDVVVLSYEYWTREMGGDRGVLGRQLAIAFRPFTIIGVAPRGFTGVELQPVDFWIPLSSGAHPRPDWETTWRARWLQVVARVKSPMTLERAALEATAAFNHAYTGTDPDWAHGSLSFRPISYTTDGVEPAVGPIARWLGAERETDAGPSLASH